MAILLRLADQLVDFCYLVLDCLPPTVKFISLKAFVSLLQLIKLAAILAQPILDEPQLLNLRLLFLCLRLHQSSCQGRDILVGYGLVDGKEFSLEFAKVFDAVARGLRGLCD